MPEGVGGRVLLQERLTAYLYRQVALAREQGHIGKYPYPYKDDQHKAD